MTGLEKIQEKIMAQSKADCDRIIAEANAKAKEILIDARVRAEEMSKKIISDAEALSEKKKLLAKSSAEALTRNRYLEVRNAIINDIISAAYEELERLSDEEYFDLIKKLCIKSTTPGEYVMHLNTVDLARLPEGFEDSINAEIYQTGAVFIKNEAADIENGFILSSDGIEINCTFRAVFDSAMDNLKDRLNNELFS